MSWTDLNERPSVASLVAQLAPSTPHVSAVHANEPFRLRDVGSGEPIELRPEVVLAGYTGRDARAVEAHLVELERQGIPRPGSVPAFYPVPGRLLARSGTTITTDARTSGEVEPVLIVTRDGWWVGVGSDHTDRDAERSDIAAGKRACPKVLSREVVRYERLRGSWDGIALRAWADGEPYQQGRLGDLRSPDEVLKLALRSLGHRPEELVLFLGTVPLREGGFVDAREFSARLEDPVSRVRLSVRYRIEGRDRG